MPRQTMRERFWSKVSVQHDGCWEWTGDLDSSGYGRFYVGCKLNGRRYTIAAHRQAYEWANGEIPEGLTLDHLCRNRVCVNHLHLEPVTVRENILRGVSVSARAARVTHCPHGHPYDLFNTYRTPNGGRCCRVCRENQARLRVRVR